MFYPAAILRHGIVLIDTPGVGSTLSSALGTHVLIPSALLFEAAGIMASRGIIQSVRA